MSGREWVNVPRPAAVKFRSTRTGATVAVGYFPTPTREGSPIPVVGAGAGKRAALAALGAAVRVIAADPELARELGFRTVPLEGVTTGAAAKLGQLVRGAQRGKGAPRRKLAALKARADQGDGKAGRLWALAQAQHGRGGVAKAAHYAPDVAAAVGATARPSAPWGAAQLQAAAPGPAPMPWVTFGLPFASVGIPLAARADAGTSALLASLSGPRQARGAISWGA